MVDELAGFEQSGRVTHVNRNLFSSDELWSWALTDGAQMQTEF